MAEPLVEADLEEINLRLDQLLVADSQIKKAEQAGLDVTTQRESSRNLRNQLLKLKQTYFPGQ